MPRTAAFATRPFRAAFALLGVLTLALCLAIGPAFAQDQETAERTLPPGTGPKHAIAMHGEPALPADFTHFPYADPRAPQGGRMVLATQGTFDSTHPFIIFGTPVWTMRRWVFESLMVRSEDEPFTMYGHIAQTIEVPEDRSWVTFTLHPSAKFSDGTPITVDDVIFSMEILREKGRPNRRSVYSKITEVNRPGPRQVQFVFDPAEADRELPLLMGYLPVLSKAFWQDRDFSKTTLDPIVGSGPYIVSDIRPGASVTFSKNPDYWAKDLPTARGKYNLEEIRYDYYRDQNAIFEAFKSGDVHAFVENDLANWRNGYDVPAVRGGRIVKEKVEHGRSSGMRGFVFNTRREIFSDPRVRQALTLAFDFEWINKNFFYGEYVRTRSYYDNSDLAAEGPATAEERALLQPFPGSVNAAILQQGWVPPVAGDTRKLRENLRKAVTLMKEAGYEIRERKMVNAATGKPFSFEILASQQSVERIALNYKANLELIGIDVRVRTVDPSQYEQRSQTFDFDMREVWWRGTVSPGNEQTFRYGSAAADQQGSFNFAGIKDPAVDAMIQKLLEARTREELVTAARALDRVLLSGYYIVPWYHSPVDRIAYWAEYQHPKRVPNDGYLGWVSLDPTLWWKEPTN